MDLQSYFILITSNEMWFSHVFCEYGDRCCTESIGILFLRIILSVLKSKLKLKSLKLNPTNKFKTNFCFIKTSKQGIHRQHGLFFGFPSTKHQQFRFNPHFFLRQFRLDGFSKLNAIVTDSSPNTCKSFICELILPELAINRLYFVIKRTSS